MNSTLFGFLIAGLATSVHCAGMCGPLACGIGSRGKSEGARLIAASLYHICRLSSYTIIGTLCGALGREPLSWFFNSPAVLLPWALVAALLLIATGLDKRIPRPAFLVKFTARVRIKSLHFPPAAGAAAMGLLTPFLPCGPLYAVFIALIASGSAARGAESAFAFGLGTVPLLWLAQSQFHRLRTRLTPGNLAKVKRGLALVAALVLAWRLHGTLPFEPTKSPTASDSELPSCCE
ncbi:sulfite exporter TauE/SafE family protein [Luteolibacter pohnpeiensis]|uniref:Sulfite exporter TauE/SafE family protein n=1 Tax=Luteolibacter pohnpeiensis TaxID=454153 RepID=A0A934S419_9BACT|nr:sulfite exporter TauE/SafE family protein [Luteolibacter pohnpeiensis]MBK1882101.1 sulfite exporter TauE/SafE family protein [Luteolibacter pohnpeiensis]